MIGAAWGEKEKLHGQSWQINLEWKNKRNLYRPVIFLGEFSHFAYKKKKKIGKFRFNSVNSRKKLKKWKILTKFTTHEME
jgi:hypothetical protein